MLAVSFSDYDPKLPSATLAANGRNGWTPVFRQDGPGRRGCAEDRDRGTPRDATPPTPPGIRVTYHGGSTELSLGRDMQLGETERVEVVVAQGLLDRRVS